jgi:fatty acid desaturase
MSGASTGLSPHITGVVQYRFEWPTWLLAATVYGGWLVLTYWATMLPWWLVLPAGAWIIAWHHSLQHELIHNHPTRKHWVNTAIGFAPLGLWLPYLRYRAMHLSHHRDHLLTDPVEDPESYYVTDFAWQRLGPIGRAVRRFLNTATGRIPFGPLVAVVGFLIKEAAALATGSPRHHRIWAVHVLGVVAVLLWVEEICGIAFWRYLLCFVYPGFALTALRSMAEHRAAPEAEHRTAVVEHAPIFGLLFLFNNLHVVHHRHPRLPWYAIPRYYRQNRDAIVRRNNGLVYHGYRDVLSRYLLREHHSPVIPQNPARGPAQIDFIGESVELRPAVVSP